ncbi:terminase [Staphylococcus aureus]|uniref:terminase n=1 Tax=Staphylococcus aureus TaxID=1280 RepID=UPI0013BE78D2|nr:terminase [Staphylococcus aureus]NEE89222.1 terminase [Staphylococcus aureus]NGG11455.1 terminase [Staphylococcus aureus]NGJ97496.1 terminase [Staphylococcus aureus]HCY1312238.1 terminase [Staphylococcus aureus]HCZ0747026.1 terminase [Staphylococcus aureus]
MDTHFMAKIMANIRDFQSNVRKAQRLAKTAVPNEIETDVKADISRFQRALQRAKAMAQKWREHNVKIDGNNSPLKRAIASAKTMLATLHNKTIKVNFDTRGMTKAQILTKALNQSLTEYSEKMDALATKIRTFGTIFAQQVKGLMIASIQALIPVIAGLVPAIMAVLNAVGVLGGGVLGLVGAFSVAGLGAVGFGAMAISALKMVEDGTLAVTKEVQDFRKASDQLKDTWRDIVKENQAKIFNAMSAGLRGITSALTKMKPFLSEVSMLVEANVRKFEEWVETSNTAKKAFESLNTIGGAIFGDLLNAAGRFGDGLVNIFTQLMPLFKFMSQGLQNMSIDFQNWANSVAGQNAIQAFIEYTKTNLPKIGKIFGNVFKGIGNLMIAFSQNSSNIFDWLVELTNKFREWSEQVGQSQGFKDFVNYVQENGPTIMNLIGNIVKALVAFGKAMAPIASKLLDFITNLADFIGKLFETHPAVAQAMGVLGILGGAFWALMAPIAAVSSVLSNVFGTSLLRIIKKMLDLTGIPNLLSKAFAPLAGVFTSISWPILLVIGIIAAFIGVVVYLWKTNETFRKNMTKAWEDVKTAVSEAIQGVIDWLSELWDKIQTTIEPIKPILEALGKVFMTVLGVLVIGVIVNVMNVIQGLWTVIKIAFEAIGTVISVAVQIIIGLFTALIQFLTGDFSGALETIKNTVSNVLDTIWEYMQSVWDSIVGFLSDVMNRMLSMFGTSWSEIWNTITKFVSNIWKSVTDWFGRVASSISSLMGLALSYIISKGSEWVSNIWNKVTEFASKVYDGFRKVVSNVGEGMSDALEKIKSFFDDFLNAGADLIGKVAEGVANAAHKVVSAVGDAISSAWDSVTSFVSGHGGGSGLGKGLAVSQAKVIASGFGNAFNKELSSTLTDSIGDPISTTFDRHMTGDVQHSLQENNRPIVNITVKNEGDLNMIKSYIDDMDAKDGSFNLM